MTRRAQHYPPELRERAVRMVAEVIPNYDSQWVAIGAQKLGVGSAETVRKWVRQGEIDAGQRPGATSEESAELTRLRRENAELRRANEILKAASAFLRGRARPALTTLVRLIAEHADRDAGGLRWGVEPIWESAFRAQLPDHAWNRAGQPASVNDPVRKCCGMAKSCHGE